MSDTVPSQPVDEQADAGAVASAPQRQMWLLQQLAPESRVNHVAVDVRIRGPLNVEWLRRSLRAAVHRHDALRTAFRPAGGTLARAATAREPQFAIEDLEGTPISERAARLAAAQAEQVRAPFDLEQGPLVRHVLTIVDEDDHHLLVVAHRMVCDEGGVDALVGDVLDCYRAYVKGQRPDPAPAASAFGAGAYGADGPGADLEYWRTRLAGLPDPLELPFTRTRGGRLSLDAVSVPFQLGPRTEQAVRDLAGREGTSPFVVVLTAFVVLLHRYTGSHDIVVGVPDTTRRPTAPDRPIGAFAEPLPLRVPVPADPTWRAALHAVRDATAELDEHRAVTFLELIRLVRPERHLNLHPLLQIVAAPLPAEGRHEIGDVVFAPAPVDSGESVYDVELRVGEHGGLLKVSRELFEPGAAATIAEHLKRMLDQLVARPDAHLSNLSLLAPAEFDTIVRDWNRTTAQYPGDTPVHRLFEAWARHTPDAPALQWNDLRFTYAQLEAQANQLAHYLRRLGVVRETRVGLYFGHSPMWVVGALATLKAGGLYVPLDPAYPEERLAAMCQDAEVSVLLRGPEQDGLRTFAGVQPVLDPTLSVAAAEPTSPLEIEVSPDGLAYIMFTSGSTGRAKAIGVTHRNIVRTVCDTTYVEFRSVDTVGQASNISFDAATWELWGALLNGAKLVGLPRADVLDPDRLSERLRALGITVFFLPAALMKQIVAQKPDTFGSLRYLFSGGEQADLHTIRQMLRHGAPGSMVNPYGPTETTVFAIVYRCNDMPESETYVPIGVPIDNTTAYVLDEYLQPVPVGVVGELFVGGPGVARGYVAQSDLTAEKFIADPFAAQPGDRMYRSGDLARYRPNGLIDFLGRIDRQVKIRGFRVEPADIESCLMESAAVREVSVQVATDRGGDQVLVAFVLPAGADVDVEELRRHARGRLPVYMVPGEFVVLSAFPLNANGKLDVVALRALREPGGGGAQAPATPTEATLCALGREAFGAEPGPSANLFQAGGDSVAVAGFVARAAERFGVDLPVRLAFEQPTVAALAAEIDRLRAVAGIRAIPAQATAAEPITAAAAGQADGLEETLLEIWRDVLGVPGLGPDDNFFDSGGHSLKVTRVVSRVKASFARDLPVSLLFENPTVTRFAASLRTVLAGAEPAAAEPALDRAEDDDIDALLDELERLAEDDPR